jgi:limonene-1,2-epoxide hydrolase
MRPVDIVRAFIAAWEARDVEGIVARLTDDVVYVNVGMSEARGRDQVRAATEPFLAACTRVEWTVTHIAETAEGAVLTERIDVFEMPGRTLTAPVMGVFELRGDRICAWRDYFDVAGFQRQMAGG